MRLQRWFNDNIFRPAKGYTAKDGTWRHVGVAGALAASLFGAAVIAGGGGVSREAHRGGPPQLASSRVFLGWREADVTTTSTSPPATTRTTVAVSQPKSQATGGHRASGGGTCDRPSTCPQLRQCENGGSYAAGTNPSFYGAYQFADRSTWGMSPTQQDAHADEMYAQRGSQPWPVCGRFLR